MHTIIIVPEDSRWSVREMMSGHLVKVITEVEMNPIRFDLSTLQAAQRVGEAAASLYGARYIGLI